MVPRPVYSITRYWSPVVPGNVAVDPFGLSAGDPFGFDEERWDHRVFRPETRSLQDLANVPCLFLLGEPGLGKSIAMNQEVRRLEDSAQNGQWVLPINLAACASAGDLERQLQRGGVELWRPGDSVLHLFLDGFDESLRHWSALPRVLLSQIAELPRERLRLRIACRSGEFPGHLGDDIAATWPAVDSGGQVPVQLVQLEALSRSAVRTWAKAKGVPADAFLAAVEQRGASAFASRPITLEGLLSLFGQRSLPNTQAQLYDVACLELCDEPNPYLQHESRLTPEHRRSAAEQVAILMTLSDKRLVWLGSPLQTPDNALALADLAHEAKTRDIVLDAAEQQSIREVVTRTALFQTEDALLMRWSQDTYREFLAAWFFASRLNDVSKALQFFQHPQRAGLVAPQLAQSASWLAALDEGVAGWLVDNDPAVLLRGGHEVPASARPRLVGWLLDQEAQGRSLDARWSTWWMRSALDHPGLANQLESVLRSRKANDRCRSLACELAMACLRRELATLISEIALDPRETLFVRTSAVRALREIGTDEAKRDLRPLLDAVEGDAGEAHQLRAQVLAVVWPSHLSTTDALDYLRLHQTGHTDEYVHTFGRRFAADLEGDHLVEALRWVRENVEHADGPLEFLVGDILTTSAARMTDAAIRSALLDALSARLQVHHYGWPGHQDEFVEAVNQHPLPVKSQFADEFVARLPGLPTSGIYVVTDLLSDIELPYTEWVVLAGDSDHGAESAWWLVLRKDHRTWTDPECFETICQAAATAADESVPKKGLEALLRDIKARRSERAEPDDEADHEQDRPSGSSRADKVQSWLTLANVDAVSAWPMLGMVLNVEDDKDSGVVQPHLVTTPGWIEAPTESRGRILQAASRFLREMVAGNGALAEDRAVVAGYQAATLLATRAPEVLDDLTSREWRYWAPKIARLGSETSDREPLRQVISTAYSHCPDAVLLVLEEGLRDDAELRSARALLDALEPCWDGRLAETLARLFADHQLSVGAFETTLSALLLHRHVAAAAGALDWASQGSHDRERRKVATRCLLSHGTPEVIEALLKTLRNDSDFACDAMRSLAVSRDGSAFPSPNVPERLLADLYMLAAKCFPPDKDPEVRFGVASDRGPAELTAELRGRLLWQLADRGTWAAIDELQRIVDARSQLALPSALWHRALQSTLRATWEAFASPRYVLEVVADDRRRVLRNSTQLLTLVRESLERLQAALVQGGAAEDLWSEWTEDGPTRSRPKRELALSRYVKRFLDRELVRFALVSNLEVQIKPLSRTDILVHYIDREHPESEPRRLALVVEVKAMWNPKLLAAMKPQLADRYLRESDASCGLYVVFWFGPDRWDPNDRQRGKLTRSTLQSLRDALAMQAQVLSDEHRTVEAVVLDASL